jgi:hypothetical protein
MKKAKANPPEGIHGAPRHKKGINQQMEMPMEPVKDPIPWYKQPAAWNALINLIRLIRDVSRDPPGWFF